MKISFKNVGQGDSIILESNVSDNPVIGIIDCKKYAGKNPVIEHLKESQPKEILFIVLSHPHQDHFSGLYDLLEYCENRGIKIKHFVHTMSCHPKYLNWAELKEEDTQMLDKIIRKAITLSEGKLINDIGHAS